jgi:hypothetical protein
LNAGIVETSGKGIVSARSTPDTKRSARSPHFHSRKHSPEPLVESLVQTRVNASISIRLDNRTDYLENRIKVVDECVAKAAELVEAYKYSLQNDLSDEDLYRRRSKLTDEVWTSASLFLIGTNSLFFMNQFL